MVIRIISTTPANAGTGNWVTAERWANLLGELGHESIVEESWSGEPCDLLIALHARRSLASAQRFRAAFPDRPLVVALTGTDVYRDLPDHSGARKGVALADRLVALQRLAVHELDHEQQWKVRVIVQSARAPEDMPAPRDDVFEVAVVGHLRAVKDPFRAAEATRLLSSTSRIVVTHVGGVLEAAMAERAARESEENPRYQWIGEVDRVDAMRTMGRSRLLVVSSRSEGGPNVIVEAIACGVPVLSSRIPGSLGLLGVDYPGYFEPEDTAGLAALLERAETDREFLYDLSSRCEALRPQFSPGAERQAWARLLDELVPPGGDVRRNG